MTDKVSGLTLTDEQIAEYIAMVEEQGRQRERNFGTADATAFAMGASVLFFATGQQDKLPLRWVFASVMNKSPFGKES